MTHKMTDIPQEEKVPDDLFKVASDALYGARNSGRSMDKAAADVVRAVRSKIEVELLGAIWDHLTSDEAQRFYAEELPWYHSGFGAKRMIEQRLEEMLGAKKSPDEQLDDILSEQANALAREDTEGLPDHHLLGTVLVNVKNERFRQERLKAEGRFKHTPADRDCPALAKFAMVGEEFGEVAKEVLTQPGSPFAFDTVGDVLKLRKELIQVAALCVAWVESTFDGPIE